LEKDTDSPEPFKLYAAAYAVHYEVGDLLAAVGYYRSIIAAYPGTPEAGYARSQVMNIVNGSVSHQTLFDAQVALALIALEARDRKAIDGAALRQRRETAARF
jgi:hypothetical protein